MKRFSFIAFLCFVALGTKAQNIQLHWDIGRIMYEQLDTHPRLVTTVEDFKVDRYGDTYFFIDMNYSRKGISAGYWEIARNLKFWEAPIALHVEYNGGLSNQFSYSDAYLLGGTYIWNAPNFKSGYTLSTLYKYIRHSDERHNFQLTGTWYHHFFHDMFTFSGFMDFWREKKSTFIFLSEPQFWWNLNRVKGVADDLNLSIGGEMKFSYNFFRPDEFFVIPTLALKWTF